MTTALIVRASAGIAETLVAERVRAGANAAAITLPKLLADREREHESSVEWLRHWESPAVLIVDEAETAAKLDETRRAAVCQLIDRRNRLDRETILVAHRPPLARAEASPAELFVELTGSTEILKLCCDVLLAEPARASSTKQPEARQPGRGRRKPSSFVRLSGGSMK